MFQDKIKRRDIVSQLKKILLKLIVFLNFSSFELISFDLISLFWVANWHFSLKSGSTVLLFSLCKDWISGPVSSILELFVIKSFLDLVPKFTFVGLNLNLNFKFEKKYS